MSSRVSGKSAKKNEEKSSAAAVAAEDSTSSSLPKPEFDVGEIVGHHWEIVQQLGCGGCGIVYRVRRVASALPADAEPTDAESASSTVKAVADEPLTAALKAESVDPNNSRYHETLRMEATVLRRLQWSSHACRLFMAGRVSPTVNAVVMTETGPSLAMLRRRCPDQRFSISTAVRVGVQCLNAIEDLHCIGFIHRDVKPSNFAIGRGANSRRIYMLDFGLARSYLEWAKDGSGRLEHRRPRYRAHFLGTERYCSPNVHERVEQGRRDDLWSLFFSIVEMIRGKLPWRNAECTAKVHTGKTGNLAYLLDRCPAELRSFVAHVIALGYESAPDYAYLRGCLETLSHRRNFRPADSYDWEKGGRYYKQSFRNFFG